MRPFPTSRMISHVTFRKALGGIVMALAFCALPAIAGPKVDCNKGQKIGAVVNGAGATILVVVTGICTENVVITRDDVTITTDGINPTTIQALDPSQPTILLDGAHRITIDGLTGVGFHIGGGTSGISASRGSTLDLSNCTVSGNSQNAVIASYGSTVSIDNCTVGPNTGNGVVAANTASLVITNSTVSGNTGQGILASRSSHIRVGQDREGTTTVKPITVSGNGGSGIVITESSSGNVVGGIVETSGSENIFVGRGSSGQIGLGSNNLTGGVTIQSGSSHGIHVEGGNATIVFSTITLNAVNGIIVNNGGSARIGILNNPAYGPTTVSNNGQVGVHAGTGGHAFIGGTTIIGNGTAAGEVFGGFGISVALAASVDLAGNNVISNNRETGIFVTRNGTALVGDPSFGLTTTNTISGNGSVGPNNGGVQAFLGGIITLQNATISNNTGAAVQAFDASAIELKGSTAVSVPGAGTTPGAFVQRSSTLILRDTASIVSATSDGIQASDLTSIRIRDANTVQGNGPTGVGIQCFNSLPMAASAVALNGNTANVTGTSGSNVGCNIFP